jgi:hypothetical protein
MISGLIKIILTALLILPNRTKMPFIKRLFYFLIA